MSGVVLVGLVWAGAGILLGIQWWRDRAARAPEPDPRDPGTPRVRFGTAAEDRRPQRLRAMRLAYALGAWLVALGLVLHLVGPLAIGALALNLGTLLRYLALALHRDELDTPALALA